MSGACESRRSCWPRLSQPRPFSILVEFRTRAISTPSTIGGSPRRKDVQPATHREKGAVVMATRSDVRKGIFQDGSDEEQTFGDRDHGGKRLSKFADRGFSALQMPGPWLWLVYRMSGISQASKSSGVRFQPDGVRRRLRVRCTDRHVGAPGGAARSRRDDAGECCCRRACDIGASTCG